MSLNWLVNQLLALVNETYLNCAVTVVCYGLNLCYYTWSSLQYGNRNQCALFVEDLCHSDLCC